MMSRGNRNGQRGVVLLMMLAVLLLGATFLLVQRLNWVSESMAQDGTSVRALAEAKAALLGWALAHPDRPGMLPYPDRNGDGNYDGDSDCPAGAVNSSMRLGRLPWLGQDSPCVAPLKGVGTSVTDGTGQRLWYAVSANVLYKPAAGGYPVINSELLNTTTGWITVLDEHGATLSNRVAAVILAPGAPLSGQNRAGAAPGPANYLDTVTIGGASYSNADFDDIFIAARRGDNFNDELIYVTADELVPLVERRIVREARQCLVAYAATSAGKYPWAARLDGGAAPDYGGDFGSTFGRIPATLNVDASAGTPDATMPTAWPSGCFAPATYWDDWKELVFYQVAAGFQPGSAAACPVCLSLNGGGNDRLIVLAAGHELSGQTRASTADKGTVSNYLEGDNATVGDGAFESRDSGAAFNDQVACIGAASCQ